MEVHLHDAPLEKRVFPLQAGHCYFLPAGVRFSGVARHVVRHFYIHFDILGAPPLLLPTFQSQSKSPIEIPDFAASQLLDRLSNQVWKTDIWSDDQPPSAAIAVRAKALLFEAFAVCLDHWPAESRGDLEWARLALEYVEAHIHQPIINAQLAALYHFSTDYFIVRFRDAIGQTPGQYILERRLATAAQKLLFSTASIETIASQSGFCNRFHFSHAFKSRFGITPGVYRKNRTI
jgi:AraC-like DNA-binding protein